jgi:DoxX-like family
MSKSQLWGGRILSALPVLALLMSAGMKLMQPGDFLQQWVKFGFAPSQATGIGLLELICTVLYIVPQTSVLGAILLTAYLGGAVVTHVRVGDPFIAPVILGVMLWGGLYLRHSRIRALIPLLRA